MSMEDLLRTEVEANLENMKDLELGSKEYESAVESTCKLVDRVISIDRNADDYDLKDKARRSRYRSKEYSVRKRQEKSDDSKWNYCWQHCCVYCCYDLGNISIFQIRERRHCYNHFRSTVH